MFTSESDSSNEGTQEEGSFDHGSSGVGSKGGEVVNVGGKAGQHSSHTNLYII